MRYRALTISREYGSGGAEIAAIVAKRLAWRLVDGALVREISARAGVPLADAATLDERVDPWLHRLMRPAFGGGADGISLATPVKLFDAAAMAELTKSVIERAYGAGDCVIVGRGSQCILSGKPDVFHVFVYAGWSERAHRVRTRVAPDTDVNHLIHATDEQRKEYVRRHFGENRLDPHLYDLMVNSRNGSESTARLILTAMAVEVHGTPKLAA